MVSDGGKPAAGICVGVDELTGNGRTSVGFTRTDADGNYVLGDLPAADYIVQFVDCDGGPLVPQWWDGVLQPEDATMIELADGEQRTGIDATMRFGGSISGTVVDTAGARLGGICVIAVRSVGDDIEGVGFTETEADGSYQLTGIAPGGVRVLFESCDDAGAPFLQQWYEGVDSIEGATVLSVEAGALLSGVDARLRPAATISGIVTGPSGDAAGGICVQVTASDRFAGSATTDDDGSYRVLIDGAGDYAVQFLDCNDSPGLAGSWFDGASDRAAAQLVAVADGQQVDGIDATLVAGAPGAVRGEVRNVRGEAMTPACVVLYAPDEYVRFSPVGADGSYAFEGVPSGTFSLVFVGCPPTGEFDPTEVVQDPTAPVAYPAIWWGGARLVLPVDGGPDPIAQGATLITVGPGGTVTADVCFGCDAVVVGPVSIGPGSVTLTFDADAILPAGPPIAAASAATSFRAECSATGAPTASRDGVSSPITVTGLRGGTTYRCVVLAFRDGVLVGASEPTTVVMAGGATPDLDDLVPGPGTPAAAAAPGSASSTPADGSASAPRSLAFVG